MRVVVTVKAYPVMTERHGETVCVAGITRGDDGDSPSWVRLYPVPFRDMPAEQRFSKWDEIEVEVGPSTEDNRPETRVPNIRTLRVVGHLDTKRGWEERRQYLAELPQLTMCRVLAEQRAAGLSLAMIRPARILDVTVEKRSDQELERARRRIDSHRSLLDPDLQAMEPLPFIFRYKYECDSSCNGHEQSIIDWELGALFRGERYRHGEERAIQSVQEKYRAISDPDRHDFALFVGNMERHLESFLAIGVFYPLRTS